MTGIKLKILRYAKQQENKTSNQYSRHADDLVLKLTNKNINCYMLNKTEEKIGRGEYMGWKDEEFPEI